MASVADAAPDELFTVKAHFWLGNYQQAISAGTSLRLTGAAKEAVDDLRNAYVYRSYIASGNAAVVLKEVDASTTSLPLQAVRLLASYKTPATCDEALATALEWAVEPTRTNDDTTAVVLATILSEATDFENALRAVRSSKTLEPMGMAVVVLLKMDRVDLAAKKLAHMVAIDDDSVISQLCLAWVHLAQGGDKKLNEAVTTLQELVDTRGPSIVLLNALGAAKMQMKQYEDAEKHFVDAIGMGSEEPATIINLIAATQHQNKPHVERHVDHLRKVAPQHPYVQRLAALERVFDSM